MLHSTTETNLLVPQGSHGFLSVTGPSSLVVWLSQKLMAPLNSRSQPTSMTALEGQVQGGPVRQWSPPKAFTLGLGKSSEQQAFSVFTDLRTTVNGLGVCLSALPSERRSAGTLMMPSAGPHTVEIHVAAHRLGHWCRCPFAAQRTVPTTGTRHHTRHGSVPSIMDGARSKGFLRQRLPLRVRLRHLPKLGLSRRQEAVFAWSTPTKVTLILGSPSCLTTVDTFSGYCPIS